MAQPPWEQPQPPGYPPSGRPRRYEQPPSYGQQAYGQQQSYGQPSYEQPSYGQSRQYPPYDQPRQHPPYDQPQYGNGQQPQYGNGGQQPPYGGAGGQYGSPGGQYGGPGGQYGGGPGGQYPPPYGPEKRGNGFAVAGIILAIVFWPLGLIFAIIGLVKSRARAGAGRGLSIAAIVVAVVVGAASISIVVIVRNSTLADPGCIAAESSARALNSTLSADDQAIARDGNNPAAEKTDIKKFGNDLQTFIVRLNAAQAEAKHQSVKDKIGQVSGDLNAMLSILQAIEKGNTSQASKAGTYANKLNSDGTAIDQICVPFG